MENIEKEISEILQSRRASAISKAEENLKKARQNINFKNLEKEEAELKFEIANLLADGKENEAKILKLKIDDIQKSKCEILKEIGLKLDDIFPQYACKICSDTGRNNCECKKEIKNLILLKSCGLDKNCLESFSEANFKDKKTSLIFSKMEEWSKKYPNVSKNTIFISGGTGTGKTFLSKCIIKELLKKQILVYYTTAYSLNKTFLKSIKEESVFDNILNSEVLVIDDLGTEPVINNITINNLYHVLNERAVANKSTIINSNLNAEEILDRYGERIFSRIFNKRTGLAIKLEGEDLRIKG